MGTELTSEKEKDEGQMPEEPQPAQRVLHPELHTAATAPTPTQPAASPQTPPAPNDANTSTPSTILSWIKRQILGPGRRAPTRGMSAGQAAYVFGMHGLGSLVVSGGVNFGIACAMYLSPSDPIALLGMPNTLAGDAALTIIIQTIVTWLIEWAVLTSDLRAGKVAPLSLPSYSSSPRFRRMLGVSPDGSGGARGEEDRPGTGGTGGKGDVEARDSSSTHAKHRTPRTERLPLPSHIPRILSLLLPSFILFWPPSLAILTTVGTKTGNDYVFATRWAPQIFKLILGGILGLVVTPFMALFWLLREGLAS